MRTVMELHTPKVEASNCDRTDKATTVYLLPALLPVHKRSTTALLLFIFRSLTWFRTVNGSFSAFSAAVQAKGFSPGGVKPDTRTVNGDRTQMQTEIIHPKN